MMARLTPNEKHAQILIAKIEATRRNRKIRSMVIFDGVLHVQYINPNDDPDDVQIGECDNIASLLRVELLFKESI